MDDFQAQLEEYRAKKRRRHKFEELKGKVKRFFMLGTGIDPSRGQVETAIDIGSGRTIDGRKVQHVSASDTEEDDVAVSTDTSVEEIKQPLEKTLTPLEQDNRIFKYTLWTVYTLFWLTLFIIAIELKFGLVFLMFSALFGIYFNTRTGPRERNEVSAYSVFNKNCESIDGTLKAEQFEREIRYGPGSVH